MLTSSTYGPPRRAYGVAARESRRGRSRSALLEGERLVESCELEDAHDAIRGSQEPRAPALAAQTLVGRDQHAQARRVDEGQLAQVEHDLLRRRPLGKLVQRG